MKFSKIAEVRSEHFQDATNRGTVRGHPATEAIFGCEIHFKHDLPHDEESINQKL